DRDWVNNITTLYQGRIRGDIPRPARTFAEQNTFITRGNARDNDSRYSAYLHLAAPINSVNTDVMRLTPVNQNERERAIEGARQVRDFSNQRVRLEGQRATGQQRGQPVQMNLPQSPIRHMDNTASSRDRRTDADSPNRPNEPRGTEPRSKGDQSDRPNR